MKVFKVTIKGGTYYIKAKTKASLSKRLDKHNYTWAAKVEEVKH